MPAVSISTDALSPMLIKELRQGVKSKAFFFAFLLMQGLMVFTVLMYLVAMQSEHDATGYNALFWTCLGATLIFIMPLRAMTALQHEIKGNTLELIFLTRLSAWRIVAGKWLALFSQSLLLTSGTLPYLLLRYFVGSIDVFNDLLALLWMLLASAVLTALGVCFSTFVAQWIRVLGYIAAFLFPYVGLAMLFGFRSGGSSAGLVAHPVALVLLVALGAALGVALCLVWGASRIAPPAENHARWKRLIALALIALLPAIGWACDEKQVLYAGFFILIPMCADALCEMPRFIPSVYAPFVRHGLAGRLAGRILCPGWPSAIPYTVIACALFAGLLFARDLADNDHVRGMIASLPGALLFPLALVLTIRPRVRSVVAGYLSIQVACIILSIVALSLHEAFSQFPMLPFCFLPTSAFVLHLAQQGDDASWIPVTAAISLAALAMLLVAMRRAFVSIRDAERAALPRPAAPGREFPE